MLKTKKELAAEKLKQKGSRAVSILFVLLLSLSVTSLMVLYIDRLPSNIIEGGIASQDIRADQNYEIIDAVATEKLRQEAERKALPVYDFEKDMIKDRIEKIDGSFSKARKELLGLFNEDSEEEKLTEDQEAQLKQNFLLNLGIALNDENYQIIRKDNFSEAVEKALSAILTPVQKRPVILDKADLVLRKDLGVVLRILNENLDVEIKESAIKDFNHILSLDDAKAYYKDQNMVSIQKKLNMEFVSQDIIKKCLKLFPSMLKVNVTANNPESDLRVSRAKDNVQSIIYKLQKGQIVIRDGDRYEKRHITILDGIRKSRLQTNIILKFVGIFLLVLSVLLVVYSFAFKNLRTFKTTRKDLNFLGLMLILFLAILRLGSFVGSSLQDTVPFEMSVNTFYYAIPIAAGTMLVRFILKPVVALIFGIVLSFFAGLFLEQNFDMTVYYFLSSIMAAYLIDGVEKRSSVLRRGLYLGLVMICKIL
ncbi:hypothetical protein BVY03_03540 [bacterium K02(2017)]|nr:hypothetical protein BVY03_03540 [bacterium K02(2017)]